MPTLILMNCDIRNRVEMLKEKMCRGFDYKIKISKWPFDILTSWYLYIFFDEALVIDIDSPRLHRNRSKNEYKLITLSVPSYIFAANLYTPQWSLVSTVKWLISHYIHGHLFSALFYTHISVSCESKHLNVMNGLPNCVECHGLTVLSTQTKQS